MIWGNFTLVFGEDFANLMSIESSWVSDHHGFMICYKFLCAMNLANCCARLFNFSLELTCTAESHMTQVTHMIIGRFNSMGEGLCQISKGSWAVMSLQTGLSFSKKVGILVKSGFSAMAFFDSATVGDDNLIATYLEGLEEHRGACPAFHCCDTCCMDPSRQLHPPVQRVEKRGEICVHVDASREYGWSDSRYIYIYTVIMYIYIR